MLEGRIGRGSDPFQHNDRGPERFLLRTSPANCTHHLSLQTSHAVQGFLTHTAGHVDISAYLLQLGPWVPQGGRKDVDGITH